MFGSATDRRLYWPIPVFAVLITSIVGYNARLIVLERATAVAVNVAGRQRGLAEQYAKDVLLSVEGFRADPAGDAVELEQTAGALLHGGEVVAVQGDDAQVHIAPLTDRKVREKLVHEQQLIEQLIDAGDAVLGIEPAAPPFASAVGKLRLEAALVSTSANDTVGELTNETARSFLRLVWVEVGLGLLGALAAIAMGLLLRRAAVRQSARIHSLVQERGRLLKRVTQAGDEERLQLSAALHDGPIQHLASLGYGMAHAELKLDSGEIGAARNLLAGVQDDLSQEIQRLRRMMAELRPPILTERGLEAALRDHLETLELQAGLSWAIESQLEERLPTELETLLFGLVREGLTNVVKHADADRVIVRIRASEGMTELEIEDDGKGFDTQSALAQAGHDHFGLMIMRERASLGGGSLELHSSRGQGTRVRIMLPTKAEMSAPILDGRSAKQVAGSVS